MFLSHAFNKIWLQHGNQGEGEHWNIVEHGKGHYFEAKGGETGMVLSHACDKVWLQEGYQGEGELFKIKYKD